MSPSLEGARSVDTDQLKVIQEALGDAWAYRTDSGEAAVEDLEEHERAAVTRYQRLARELGLPDPS